MTHTSVPLSLAGRTALVVGTSPNIGAGIACELARAGAQVGCIDRDPVFATSAAKDITDVGGAAHGVACDATDPAAVSSAVVEVCDRLGTVDLLVNGVVAYNVKGLLTMEFHEWQRQLSIMLDSTFLFTSLVVRRLVAEGLPGSVINLISTAGHQGEAGNIGYTTVKGGLLNFTRSAAMELAPHGIRVNSLTPTATDLTEWDERSTRWGVAGPPDGFRASLTMAASQVPLGELPRPSDYGKAAAFLGSDAARMITGVDLPVDAGSLARYWRVKPVDGP